MNLLELLHNEKVVRLLEKIDKQLKDLIESNTDDVAIGWKLILIVETLLTNVGSKNGHIGEYFKRYSVIQNEIDDVIERIKQLKVKIVESEYEIDDLNEKIKEGGYSVDIQSFEGIVFKSLKKQLIENKKLNYKYGK
jgi:uncharacterized protein YaaN involved in tellurite resistance